MNDDECDLHGFSDADWAEDADDQWSTSGYVFKVATNNVIPQSVGAVRNSLQSLNLLQRQNMLP